VITFEGGYLEGQNGFTKFTCYLFYSTEKIGPPPVHLVYEIDSRDMVSSAASSYKASPNLNTGYRTKNDHRTIKNTEHPVHLSAKIHMAWSIQQIKEDSFMDKAHSRCFNCYSVLAFNGQIVGSRCAIVDISGLFTHSCDMQNTLGNRCLAGIYMGENTYISDRRPEAPPRRL